MQGERLEFREGGRAARMEAGVKGGRQGFREGCRREGGGRNAHRMAVVV